MTRSPLSSLVSVNLILGRVDGACWANAVAANASMASSFMKAPDGNTYSTRWRGGKNGGAARGVRAHGRPRLQKIAVLNLAYIGIEYDTRRGDCGDHA